jgi:maltooligosyltrehalose trehalohydrolase
MTQVGVPISPAGGSESSENTDFRRMPVGAESTPDDGVHFRLWAPDRNRVTVVLAPDSDGDDRRTINLHAEGNGYHSALVPDAAAGARYGFLLDDDPKMYPDPVSRFQPDGSHGPSEVIDPSAFTWTDAAWRGVPADRRVIYEMHVGTFTQQGTWAAAVEKLPHLAETGITVLEVMPVCEFPGRFGWGYDGVNFFAPYHLYGRPDDFRRFVDAAHGHGLAVILDVVYNHAGPDGNYLPQFSARYFSETHDTDWGKAINFDGPDCGPVREYFLANAGYWIDEFHIDGLRLDATQDIHDDSDPHIIAEIAGRVRSAAGDRETLLVAENEPQDTRMLLPRSEGGFALDAAWNDDYHHTAMVRLTGRAEAYYTDYKGTPQEFISAVKYGFLYQGQWYSWQKQRRGTSSLNLDPRQLVAFVQNHDQIANTSRGLRAHSVCSPGCYRAMTALLLLGPNTPMLFQGQEFAASSPFFYFADHREDLAKLVDKGRREFMKQFASIADPEVQAKLPDPADPATFLRSKLDHAERDKHAETYALHRDLLALRRDDPAFRSPRRRCVDGAVLGDDAFVLRFVTDDSDGSCAGDRLVIVNFGPDVHLEPSPEPLLAPPSGCRWQTLWSSEDFSYGGTGTAPLETDDNWFLPGQATVVLRPAAGREVHPRPEVSRKEDDETEP